MVSILREPGDTSKGATGRVLGDGSVKGNAGGRELTEAGVIDTEVLDL